MPETVCFGADGRPGGEGINADTSPPRPGNAGGSKETGMRARKEGVGIFDMMLAIPETMLCLAFTMAALLTQCLQASTSPVPYTQQVAEQGILIKAPSDVDKAALAAAAAVVRQMLGHARPDIRARLAKSKAAIGIAPKNRYVTALPEFAYQSGRKDANGNDFDSFKIRGLGAVAGQPVTATAEENLLNLQGDSMQGMSVTHHEFAHAIMNLGFSYADRAAWTRIYRNGAAGKRFKDCGREGRFAMGNPDEYWAVLSTAYFSRNWSDLNTPETVKSHDAAAYRFIESVYGPPTR